MGGLPNLNGGISSGQLGEVMASAAARKAHDSMPPHRQVVVINVLDILNGGHERKKLWLQVIGDAAAAHQIVLAVPSHNSALDFYFEMQLQHTLAEDCINMLRHGPNGHILASYAELKDPNAGIIASAPRADIFISTLQTGNDVLHSMYINPTFEEAPELLRRALSCGTALNRHDLPPIGVAQAPAGAPAVPQRV